MAGISGKTDELIFPMPDAEGIAKVQQIYKEKVGKEITESEAWEVLQRVMRYLWLLNFTHPSIDGDMAEAAETSANTTSHTTGDSAQVLGIEKEPVLTHGAPEVNPASR